MSYTAFARLELAPRRDEYSLGRCRSIRRKSSCRSARTPRNPSLQIAFSQARLGRSGLCGTSGLHRVHGGSGHTEDRPADHDAAHEATVDGEGARGQPQCTVLAQRAGSSADGGRLHRVLFSGGNA